MRINPLRINKNGIGLGEWLFFSHSRLKDGTKFIYGYERVLGDPTFANVSDPGKHADGGPMYSIRNDCLAWELVHGLWKTSVNANGVIIETHTEN